MSTPLPVEARLSDEHTLFIAWSDGARLAYPLDLLRAKCPCAQCVDEWTGVVRVDRSMFPGMSLRSLEEVGSYAVRITFSDGHDVGLYTFRNLRQLGSPS